MNRTLGCNEELKKVFNAGKQKQEKVKSYAKVSGSFVLRLILVRLA